MIDHFALVSEPVMVLPEALPGMVNRKFLKTFDDVLIILYTLVSYAAPTGF